MAGGCHWPGCAVEGRDWCLTHWGRLPASMRERLRHAFVNEDDLAVVTKAAREWAHKDDLRMRGWEYDL